MSEFEEQNDEDEGGRPRKKKFVTDGPTRIRDEVLALLLELNRKRATEEGEVVAVYSATPPSVNGTKTGRRKPKARSDPQSVTIELGEA